MLHGQFASFTGFFKFTVLSALAVLLVACGGGGGGGPTADTSTSIGGGGVKGPLAGAIVTAYAFDAAQPGFKGAIIDTGTTDANAKIIGLALTLPLSPPYILEFTSDAGTTDITTGVFPVITTMRTVLTQALLDTGEDVYATPLTTMATDLAVANADSTVLPYMGDGINGTSAAEFVAALEVAASQVASTLGFGIDSSIDIFDTPPLVDSTTDTTAEQTDVAAYRAAVEALTAIVYEMDQQSSGTTSDSVLAELTSDLANDGVIDGVTEGDVTSTVLTTTTLDVLDQDPALLPIPNDPLGQTVGDIEAILVKEAAIINPTTDVTDLGDGTITTVTEPAETNPDIDGDGVMNADDAFPTDPTEDTDTDGDGTGNNADTDDDNDGVDDLTAGGTDVFPLDPTEHVDTDGDGIGNNADTDDDGDGTLDVNDDFPLDNTKQNATDVDNDGWPTGQDLNDTDNTIPGAGTPFVDTDGDGLANSGGAANDDDDDNDGVLDINDCAPLDASKNVDTDGDGTCDIDDGDIDGDTVLNADDAYPNDPTADTDTDGDGLPDIAYTDAGRGTEDIARSDDDDDNDGILDTDEVTNGTDPLLRDSDGDSIFDNSDAFPNNGSETIDTDGDCGATPMFGPTDGNGCANNSDVDGDNDNDGLLDTVESSTGIFVDGNDTGTKPLVADTDGDTLLDGAEVSAGTNPLSVDTDGDTVNDNIDVFPTDATETVDGDGDGVGDNGDNCPNDANADQLDTDGDTQGDACDLDDDNDGVADLLDSNPINFLVCSDTDADSCDDCSVGQDGFGPLADNDPANDGLDTDADGFCNVGDADDDNDGLSDADEATAGSDPLNPDTDGDGTNDGADAFPTDASETTDTDGDGVGDVADNCLTNANASQINTDGDAQGDACDLDDDNDGLSDADEATAGSDPLVTDTDADGLTDGEEVNTHGTDPTNVDSDSDTINDGAEIAAGTNPLSNDTDSDTILDAVDNCPLVVNTDQADGDTNGVGDACDVDTDSDGVSDSLDNCPNTSNADQLDTDSDGAGNVCDADDDNDNLSDIVEAGLGTDPLLADTDSDTYNDDVDVFPLDVNEWADGDSDTVGDNGDNCPTDANTDQLNTDGDAEGNVCDADDDNDNLTDVVEAGLGTDPLLADTDSDTYNDDVDVFPLDVNEWADTDSDTVGDNGDNCPTVANTDQADANADGVGDACDVDATGVWKITKTLDTLTPLVTDGCIDNDPVGTVVNFYMTMTQTGNTLTARTVSGVDLSGTIDASGAFTLSGVDTYTDPFTGDVETNTLSVTGATSSATTWDGTDTGMNAIQPSGSGSTDVCLEEESLSGVFVYKHTGSEDYNGVYTLELAEYDSSGNTERNSFALQLEISGSTMAIHLPYNDPNETITNTSFDPNTGFFSFDLDGVEDYDDGFGSEEWHDKMTGILVRAPGEATLPSVAWVIDRFGAEYDAIGGSGGGGTLLFTDQGTDQAYGKRQNSIGFTRSSYYLNNATSTKVQGIFMGMSHPPVKTTNELYVEVLDGATRLCTGLYSKRYTNARYLPVVDMSAEAFQTPWYSFVTCDTSGGTGTQTAFDGMNYTVRIMDTGIDGVVDGGDDTEVAGSSMTVAAEVSTDLFTQTVNVFDFDLNGAKPSQTMVQGALSGTVHLFGLFDINEDLNFSWTGLTGAERYTLETKEPGDFAVTRVPMAAAGTATESITLPAGTMNPWGEPELIRIRARKDEFTDGPRALAISSKWLYLHSGIKGLFNVELGGAVDRSLDTFQLWLDGDMGDGMTGNINECTVTNNPNWTCNFGSINYDNDGFGTNSISLNMTDNINVATVTLDIEFTSSATGFVDSADITLNPTQTHMRLVNPEFSVRSLQPSGGVPQQSMAVLRNTIGAGDVTMGGLFDKAILKREDNTDFVVNGSTLTGVTSKLFWKEFSDAGGTTPFSGEASTFQNRPTDDGLAQSTGHFVSNRTNSDWSMGPGLLSATTYKSVWLASNDPIKWVFKKDYTAPDASVLVTPVHNQVTVDVGLPTPVAAGVGVGDAGNPIDASTQPAFGLTWTGSVPSGGQWQIRIRYTAGSFAGADVRTVWMADGHPDLVESPVGTWTWNNGEGISVDAGDTVEVQIRAREGSAFTMLGVQQGIDRVYLTNPAL